MIDVLLIIDNIYRELAGILLIQHFFKNQLGLSSKICSRFNAIAAYNKYQPKAVVFPNAASPIIEEMSKRSYVFILPSESGNGQKTHVLSINMGTRRYPCYTEYVDHFFSWGKQMTEWLIESGAYSRDRISSTGHPATDHWLIPTKKSLTQKIGLTTTFRALSGSAKQRNLIKMIYETEIYGGEGSYYLPPEHAESWFYWEASFVRVICNLVTQVVIPNSLSVELRPHPFEQKHPYLYLTRQTKGLVNITKEGIISEWFQNVDLLLTFMSGSSIDAIVTGLPVVSLKNVLNKDALSRIPEGFLYDYDQYFWQLQNLEQVKEYCQDAFKGKLPIAREPEKLKDYIYRHFHFPRERPAALLVAEKISDFLKNNPPKKFRLFHTTSSAKFRLYTALKYIPFSTALVMGYRYIEDYFQGINATGGPRVSYLPWRWEKKIKAKRTVEKIIQTYKSTQK